MSSPSRRDHGYILKQELNYRFDTVEFNQNIKLSSRPATISKMGRMDENKGVVHKVLSVLFRTGELVSAIIVLALLGRFTYYVHGHSHNNGRVVYTMEVAAIGIIFSILVIAPFTALFLSFPFDFIM